MTWRDVARVRLFTRNAAVKERFFGHRRRSISAFQPTPEAIQLFKTRRYSPQTLPETGPLRSL
jgi:hypothetical protein